MKYTYLILVFIFLSFTHDSPVKIDKKLKEHLNGKLEFATLKEEYLFISYTEVSNDQYLAFLNWTLQHKGIDEYNTILPDTTVWVPQLDNNYSVAYNYSVDYNNSHVKYYLRHGAYKDYPVVGVNYLQAQAYCKWKADRIMETEEFKKSNIEKIAIRLPSEKEWMAAARGILPENSIWPWPDKSVRVKHGPQKNRGKILMNFNRNDGAQGDEYLNLHDAGFYTTPVYSYWPNTIGLYTICGNVSEWVEEKKVKGGSWAEMPYSARIDYPAPTLNDSFATSTIGFRPILEVVKYKKSIQTKPIQINAQYLEETLAKISEKNYASIFETSNLLYNSFLAENNNPEYAVNNKGWGKHTRYLFMQEYSWHPHFDDYPVVNITYESAVKFCEWLTQKYNQSAKRKFKKVIFRLPNESEWQIAALGDNYSTPFPWGGPNSINSKGNYLSNYTPFDLANSGGIPKTPMSNLDSFYYNMGTRNFYTFPNNDSTIGRGLDGYIFTCKIQSYYPNSNRLYNCSGNVSEMVSEKGISKGGSWSSSLQSLVIKSKETYSGSDANLGFRYFMEVLEL